MFSGMINIIPTQHEMLNLCWLIAGAASVMQAQHLLLTQKLILETFHIMHQTVNLDLASSYVVWAAYLFYKVGPGVRQYIYGSVTQ